MLKALMRRMQHFGQRPQFERELDDEIQFHIEARAEELQNDGLAPAAALDQARREFGPRARMTEDTRAAWRFQWLEDVWRDLTYAARSFAANPGFTAVAVLSLGIGVGANTVMFSMVEAMLLRLPRVPRPSQVVAVISTALDSKAPAISYPDYEDLRDRSTSFKGIAGFVGVTTGFAAHAGLEPRVKEGKLVTGNFFDVLEIGPEIGRSFLPEEDRVPGKDMVVILSQECWQEDFGSDRSTIGRQARINGTDFTIIGILPKRFSSAGQAILTDTVLHGPVTPVLSLKRHSRAETTLPEPPVTFVVMTLEADCPGDTDPGSQAGVSGLMATPFGSTHVIAATVALVSLVRTRSSGADPGPLLVSLKRNVSV